MQNLVPLPYENRLQLDEKAPLVSQYCLPSFRDGFSHWVEDTSHMKSAHSEIALDRVCRRQEKAGLQLPSVSTLLEREWY